MSDIQASEPLRLALVGAGGLGRVWTRFITGLPQARLSAIVDPLVGTDNEADWISEDYNDLPKVTSLADLDGTDLDAVVVTAFSTAHHAAVSAALDKGLHVIVEKPFAVTMAEAEDLVKKAEERGLTLMVSQNYRYFPGASIIRDIVADGRYGKIAAAFCQFNLDWPGKPYQHGMTHAMGLEMGIHHFDMCRALFTANAADGYVREWQPAGSQYAAGGAIEALFDMKGETAEFPFTYSGNLVSRAPRSPWPGQWRFEFDTKTVLLDTIDGRYGLYACEGDVCEWLGQFDGEDMMFDRPLSHFIDCVRQGKQPWSSGRDNLETLRMALGAEYFGSRR
ncbi:dehydrogenase [Devosia pacifica]|uniref:Dehydrogenase n=1 Tax=Devosia pacifica TaxID=1335967 RepID=A0A918VTY6_9HYPH|nr:Gfo/Idh/MocA family oxidoreductase [Devosia pacifica]GHA25194.1 dehydrogenase [Devosia pacifica]